MRLIDADALFEKINRLPYIERSDIRLVRKDVVLRTVDRATTLTLDDL